MNEPRFWNDSLSRVPLCNELIENSTKIKNEILQFIETENPLRDYPQFSYVNPRTEIEEALYENSWKVFPLSKFNEEFNELSEARLGYDIKPYIEWAKSGCPFTTNLLADLEHQGNLANAFVSRVEPGCRIKAHRGWCFTYLRIQLGLKCDPDCKITVGDETQTWEEGRLLAFKDGGRYPHSVIHNGTGERIILSIDLRLIYLKRFIPNIF